MFKTDKIQSSVDRLTEDYGRDWREWLPDTLVVQINQHYGGIEDIDRDRLLAARNLLNEGQFWTTPEIFSATILAFNWVDAEMGLELHPSPGQIVLGTKMAQDLNDVFDLTSPEESVDHRFEESVKSYVASIFIDRSFVFVPREFGVVSDIQDHLNKYFQDPALSGAVEAKWQNMMDHAYPNFEENDVDVQSGRLLAIKKFMDLGGVSRQRDRVDALHKIVLD